MIFAKYKFVGEDGSCGLKQGSEYCLCVDKLSLPVRLVSVYPYSWKIIAFRPFELNTPIIPYTCMESFNANWKKVDETDI